MEPTIVSVPVNHYEDEGVEETDHDEENTTQQPEASAPPQPIEPQPIQPQQNEGNQGNDFDDGEILNSNSFQTQTTSSPSSSTPQLFYNSHQRQQINRNQIPDSFSDESNKEKQANNIPLNSHQMNNRIEKKLPFYPGNNYNYKNKAAPNFSSKNTNSLSQNPMQFQQIYSQPDEENNENPKNQYSYSSYNDDNNSNNNNRNTQPSNDDYENSNNFKQVWNDNYVTNADGSSENYNDVHPNDRGEIFN